jgi:IclR family pca regulon transcriptional regulator
MNKSERGAMTVSTTTGADEWPVVEAGRPRTDLVQSLERGLAVLRCFTRDEPALTLSEVAVRTGLTRAAARRFLLTLEHLGYVTLDGRRFSLRPRVLELGYTYLSSFGLPEIAEPHLEALVERTHESSSVSVLDGDDIVYVSRIPTKRIMTVSLAVGSRLPAYATSMGRVLLGALPPSELGAYLDRVELRPLTPRTIVDRDRLEETIATVRSQGWCLVDQELEEGVRSVSAPLTTRSGKVVAAINVSAHASRITLDQIRQRLVPEVRDAAAAISADLQRRL